LVQRSELVAKSMLFLRSAFSKSGGGARISGRDHQEQFLLGSDSYCPKSDNFKKRIWFSFENIRPPVHLNFDLTLGTDQDSYGGKNVYFPWLNYVLSLAGSEFDTDLGGGRKYSIPDLLKSRTLVQKSKFVCMIINNFHPVRMEFARQLSKFGEVEIFGRAVGKPIDSKFDLVSDYKFMICFENDLYPGWVTEKPLHAWICNSIPLYWGDFGTENFVNERSLINYKNFPNMESMVNFVGNLRDDEYRSIYSEPFLSKMPSYSEIDSRILDLAKESLAQNDNVT